MSSPPEAGDRVVLGYVSGVYGVRGWLKVWSYTDPPEGILDYAEWQLRLPGGWETHAMDAGQRQGRGLVAHLAGCDDRDAARRFVAAEIAVPRTALPELEDGEYYWHQLEGLRVLAVREGAEPVWLGNVDHLFATGANEVLVVKPAPGSRDARERMIPWVPDQVVLQVDLERGELRVDWDPDF